MIHKFVSSIILILPVVLVLVFWQDELHVGLLTNCAALEYLHIVLQQDQSVVDVAEKLSTTETHSCITEIARREQEFNLLWPSATHMKERWKTIEQSLGFVQSQISLSRLASQRAYRTGLLQQEKKQWQSAFHLFESALQTDSTFVPALLSVAEISNRLNPPSDVAYWINQVRSIEPDHTLNVPIQPSLKFIGFDLDENAFALTSNVPIVIYWRFLNNEIKTSLEITEDEQYQTYVWSDRAIQVGNAKNLVSNAGFERIPFIATSLPPLFSRVYTAESIWSPYHLKVQTRQNIQSTTLCLTNDTEHYRTGVTTPPLKVEPGKQYLAAIWVKDDATSNGSPTIYETSTAGHDNLTLHSLTRLRSTDGEWHFRATIITITQPFVRFWLTNFDAVGEACFDNLLLIPLSSTR